MSKAATDTITCAYCGAASADPHFCSACGRIQPLPAGVDYFSFLGLPRQLRLDEAELEKTFYALSRKFHPDYFMAAGEAERLASAQRSATLNDAYRTLRDPIRRTAYLLSLAGYKEAEKKAPPDLLEEVFELNMQVEELRAAKKMGDEDEVNEAHAALEEALAGLNDRLRGLDEKLFALWDEWDAPGDDKKAALDRMSDLLAHRKYIRNLVRDIKEEL